MPKQEFTRVTMDITTYERLTQLANTASLSRAEYIRRLIWNQDIKKGVIPEPVVASMGIGAKLAALSAQGINPVVKRGEVMAMSDLPLHLRAVTEMAKSFGVTIDREKWQQFATDWFAEYLKSTLTFIRAEGRPIGDS